MLVSWLKSNVDIQVQCWIANGHCSLATNREDGQALQVPEASRTQKDLLLHMSRYLS